MHLRILVLPLALAGCALFGGPVDVGVRVLTDPVEVDVGADVDDRVDALCADPEAASCAGPAALCALHHGEPCDPVVLPGELAVALDVDGDGTLETVDQLLGHEVMQEARLAFALPIDLTDELDCGSGDALEDLSLDEVRVAWPRNTLTFDAPVLDVFVGPPSDGDAEELLDQGGFTRIGRLGRDIDGDGALDVGQEAGSTEDTPLSWVSGGQEALEDAVRGVTFTIVVASADGHEVSLLPVDGEPDLVHRPDGVARVAFAATVRYRVKAAKGADALACGRR